MVWTRIAPPFSRPPLGWTLAACAVILAARRPDLVHSPQFWAEDGTVFFLQAHTLGVAALLEPYAGYLHTVLRLVAWLGTALDPMLAPALYVAATGGLTLYVAARTQSARFPFRPSPLYALAFVLVPDAYEVLLTLTNLQWVLAGGLLLVLIAREPERPAQAWHDGVAVALLGLTGPFGIVLLPLFVARALRRRTRFSVILAGVAAAVACIQSFMIMRNGLASGNGSVAWEMVLGVPGLRVGGSLLSGGRWTPDVGWAGATALGVLTLAVVGWLAARRGPGDGERRLLGLAFAGLLAVGLYRCRDVLPALLHGAGSRYFFPLQLILLWLGLAAALEARRWRAVAAWTLIIVVAAANLPRWREPAFADLHWAEYAARIRRGESVTVRINPDWTFAVPGSGIAREARPDTAGSADALVNLSTRAFVTAERPLLAGFALRTSSTRTLLVRAVGPSLAQFGVAAPLPRPHLTLVGAGVNEGAFQPLRNGGSDPRLRQATQRCRAFALQPGADDLVGLVELPAGVYSVIVGAGDQGGGEVLLEIYEVPVPVAPDLPRVLVSERPGAANPPLVMAN